MSAVLPALLSAGAAAVACAPRDRMRRLRAALPPPPHPGRTRAARRVPPAVAASAVAALAAVLVVGGVVGLVLGAAVAAFGPRLLGRLEPQAVRRERERFEADLPLAMDLLAACLLGGAALPAAVEAVASAVPGPCGDRLAGVAAALAVGSPAAEAWQGLTAPATGAPHARSGALSGPPGGEQLAASAVRALVRAVETGTPPAAAVARLAAEARELSRARGEQAAERAAVLAVGPLGLCFLPAFVLLGIVPVVAGLVGPLLAGF